MAKSKPTEPEAPAESQDDLDPKTSEAIATAFPDKEAAAEPEAKAKPAKGKKAASAGPEAMPGLIEGRVVHYTLPDGKRRGEHRAATVSYVWDHGAGLVNLHVLLNGDMDYAGHAHPGNNWLVEKVAFSADPKVEGCWHWMERA
jgi:hypothetical protein